MRHLPAAPALLLAALAAASACTGGQEAGDCPGVQAGAFALVGTRTAASCQGGTVPTDGTAACARATPPLTVDCQAALPTPACCFDGLFPPSLARFDATVAYGSQGASAALCTGRPGSSAFLGTRTSLAGGGGETLSVTMESAGAVLASCASACAVTVHHAITGTLTRDPSGGATGFTGELTETASATPSATCAPCTTPCSGTWTLAPSAAPVP